MKKFLNRIVALTAAVLISMMSVPTVFAESTTPSKIIVDGIVYEMHDDYAILIKCNDKTISGKFVIPSKVNGKEIIEIAEYAFINCTEISEAVIPEGIVQLNTQIFRNCSKLEKITVPKSAKSISVDTFWGCKWYSDQPDGVIYINNIACDIKNGSNLGETIKIADGTKSFSYKFGYNEKVLKSIILPDSVVELPSYFLAGSKALESIKFSKNIEYIGYGAFQGTKWLEDRNAEEKGDCYIGKTYFRYFGDLPANSEVKIKDGTKSVTIYAFFFQKNLKKVSFPESMKTIDDHSFIGCEALEEVTIPANTEYVGYQSFNLCKSLKKVTILNPDCVLGGMDYYDYGCVFTNEAEYTSDHSDFIAVYDGVIRGLKDSTAQKYAEKYGVKFEECNDSIGDVNEDGSVNALDASEILTVYAKTAIGQKVSVSSMQRFNADVNSDGTINAIDASLVLGYYAYKATGGKLSISGYLKK